jgi:hypothetical protein
MERIDQYRRHIEEIIKEHARYPYSHGDIEIQTVFDRENDHYLLMAVGWDGYKRSDGFSIHVDIKDGKIWIQWDGTEYGVANELVARGVPKEDIVLAFHAPYKRPYTGFAVG